MKHWYLIYTKPQAEIKLNNQLLSRGYTTYLPMLLRPIEKQVLTTDCKIIDRDPMFPRYLFVELEEGVDSFEAFNHIPGFVHFVRFGQSPAKVLEEFKQTVESVKKDMDKITEKGFQEGDRIKMTEGPFKDWEGVYKEPDGEKRAYILIDNMNHSIKVNRKSFEAA